MKTETLRSIIGHFAVKGTITSITPFGSGHINDTFLAETAEEGATDYILQRVNHAIFPRVDKVMENMERVIDHLKAKYTSMEGYDPSRNTMTIIPTLEGALYLFDEETGYWRVLERITQSRSYDQVTDVTQAYEAGKAFGEFQKLLADLPGEPLFETLPNFHNVAWRLENFEKAVADNKAGRAASVQAEIDFVRSRAEEMKTILRLGEEGKIPSRITHNDTKINNVLLDEQDRALCVIDMDTVMPGFVHYDFGDAIRTSTNTGAEDDKDLRKVSMNINYFEAFTKGFLSQTADTLNEVEIEHLAGSAKLITYIMGVRFLTDYLDGDNYYKIAHKEHNIQRTQAQFKLVESMEQQYEEMQEIVKKAALCGEAPC
ncbi:aminoglycoside phosphotransferase family protein [Limibacter armeniacum]|uniref:phosphotransferase enzyme family protein n=1 Tax=Limibacter armeniacum TaxID=466084 RepID=UPI002FE6AD8D